MRVSLSRSRSGSAPTGRRGFTMIEVMMAITVLMVGVSALFALHGISQGAGMGARRTTTASVANRRFMNQMRLASLRWGQGGTPDPWFDQIPAAPGVPSEWFFPEVTADYDARSNWWGRQGADVNTGATPYCTHIRLTRLGANGSTVRVDVRTWWHRDRRSRNGGAVASLATFDCDPSQASVDDVTAALANVSAHVGLGVQYSSTVLRAGR